MSRLRRSKYFYEAIYKSAYPSKGINMNNGNEKCKFYGVASLIFFFCCLLFYPGIFSSDSIDQLNQAINSSYASWHPAIMAIVMHYLYKPFGIGGIFIIHQFLYWLAWTLFFDLVLRKRKIRYLFLGFFTPLFLISLTVWKDTGTLVSLFLSVVLITIYLRNKRTLLLIPICILLFYGFNVRTNGFITVSSLIFSIFLCFFLFKQLKTIWIILNSLVLSGVFCILFFSLNLYINQQYRVVEVNALPSLVLWDVAGINHHLGLNNIPPPKWAIRNSDSNNWIEQYKPNYCSICWTSNVKCGGDPQKTKEYLTYWMENILKHPIAYLTHRINVAKNLYGLKYKTYFPYQSHKYQNRIGGEFSNNRMGILVLRFFYATERLLSALHLYQPILYILLSIYCWMRSFQQIFINRIKDNDYLIIFSVCTSSLVSAFSLFVLAVAADYRYLIWTILGAMLSFLLLINKKDEYLKLREFCKRTKIELLGLKKND